MSNRRSRLSYPKATESIGPARIFRRRVVRKSSALACIRGRPDFLPARSDLIVKILVCCREMGSYPETTFEDTSPMPTSGQFHVSFAENHRCDPMSAFG